MKRNIITIAGLTVLTLVAAAPARADLIITLGRSDFQPEENLLFNLDGLADHGLTVQGETNNTQEVFNLTGREKLETPSGGQARVDGYFDSELDSMLIDALRPVVYYTEFEANLHVGGKTSGTFTVTACNQLGTCESATFSLGSGENTFGVESVAGQLIDTVSVRSTVEVDDIRQIRLGGVQELHQGPGPQQVTEPSLAAAMGLGIVVLGVVGRKRA
jgi:hypothetical protein